jgi:predicted Zn-dependent protease
VVRSPSDPLIHALRRKGELDEAANNFERELEINSGMLLAMYHLGKIDLDRGRTDRAAVVLGKLVETAPDFRPGLEAFAQVLLKKREAAHAVRILERASKLDPNWPDVHFLLGRAYMMVGRQTDAHREFAAAKRISENERQRLEEKVSGPKSKRPTHP